MPPSEFELIDRFFRARSVVRADVAVGIGDDAAVVRMPRDCELVAAAGTVTPDTQDPNILNPESIGHRALALPLCRLAGCGATPAWATLALSLPSTDERWLDGFSKGLSGLARRFGVQLVGGDTTRGPMIATIIVTGTVPCGQRLDSKGAGAGDSIWVTGSLGAYATEPGGSARTHLEFPEPPVAAGPAARGLASAAGDLCAGLGNGLAQMLTASSVGATLHLDRLPVPGWLHKILGETGAWHPALSEGGDHELCFTVDASKRAALVDALRESGVVISEIGSVNAEPGIRCTLGDHPVSGPGD